MYLGKYPVKRQSGGPRAISGFPSTGISKSAENSLSVGEFALNRSCRTAERRLASVRESCERGNNRGWLL
jgi:hypothetical protein